jgi:uncharacterized protein DUF3300
MTQRMITAAVVLSLAACGSSARPQTAQQPPATGTLDQMLAPIALYPDPLLAQMMMSAVDPAKVSQLDQWLRSSPNLKGTELQNATVKAGFDASYVALAIFPQVVSYMAQNIAWTTALGQWFTNDRNALFDSIQRLRAQAASVGTLKSTPQQEVETKTTESGQQVIVIEPTNPQIVYVPQYNPEVVYTQAPSTTTVVVQEDNDADVAVAAGLIGFTAGIAIGAAMDNNYYYGPYGWHGGGYMYANAWDDYYDHREDAREDYIDHREDLAEERTDRRENTQEQRSDRTETRQENRTDRAENRPEATDAQRQQAQQRSQERQSTRTQGASTQSASTERSRTGSTEARGYSSGTARTQSAQRSSDAFSGYSSGASQRASSSRGTASRSSAASRGGGGGGGRRR